MEDVETESRQGGGSKEKMVGEVTVWQMLSVGKGLPPVNYMRVDIKSLSPEISQVGERAMRDTLNLELEHPCMSSCQKPYWAVWTTSTPCDCDSLRLHFHGALVCLEEGIENISRSHVAIPNALQGSGVCDAGVDKHKEG